VVLAVPAELRAMSKVAIASRRARVRPVSPFLLVDWLPLNIGLMAPTKGVCNRRAISAIT